MKPAAPPGPPRPTPRWLLAALLAGLNTLGPFSIDAYLPAFAAIGDDLRAGPLETQETLSVYLAGFALMLLFHGALSDAFGRRPVVLASLAAFGAASVGCALAPSMRVLVALRFSQGLAAGCGMVVSRAIIRDLFELVEAQRMLSRVTMLFGVAPAVAPIVGGALYVALGWRSVFAFMAAVSVVLFAASARYLAESLPAEDRRPLRVAPLARGYAEVVSSPSFVLLSLAVALNYTAFFLYIASAPAFVQRIVCLGPTQFAWLFLPGVSGIMLGSFLSGRSAGRLDPRAIVALGYALMTAGALGNVLYTQSVSVARAPWAVVPIMTYTTGMSFAMPAISLLILDLFPRLRGMAASLQGFVAVASNSLVSGLLSPSLAASARTLAGGMAALLGSAALCWLAFRRFADEPPSPAAAVAPAPRPPVRRRGRGSVPM